MKGRVHIHPSSHSRCSKVLKGEKLRVRLNYYQRQKNYNYGLLENYVSEIIKVRSPPPLPSPLSPLFLPPSFPLVFVVILSITFSVPFSSFISSSSSSLPHVLYRCS